jgi:hypothetical protein
MYPDSCPKCRSHSSPGVKYADYGYTLDGTPLDECLRITCRKCGYTYEMECAS